MELKANVNFDRFEAALQVVDAHTVGEFCRMVIGGFPEPEGKEGCGSMLYFCLHRYYRFWTSGTLCRDGFGQRRYV